MHPRRFVLRDRIEQCAIERVRSGTEDFAVAELMDIRALRRGQYER